MLKQFDNVILDIVFDPFFYLIADFIFLSCLDLFNDNIIEVIVDNFSDFVAAFAVVFRLMFT